MTIEQAIVENLRDLPPEKNRKYWTLFNSLKQKILPRVIVVLLKDFVPI
ncbi:MAG: hypothetical protein SAK29_31220 [Scytonema sp. PMC 1069.18]|nr:hypothetical protein [Scytonema sp. PMC 1069.18]MEC4879852.1 hypothetical protein [Scytonema sp. PMC 1070.18]